MFKMVSVDNGQDYYKILGVPKDASQDDLKKAYREAAMKYHPDRGGDPEKFKELAQAYGVVRDPETRETYHMFRQDIVLTLKVSLEDLYNGASKTKRFRRIAICSDCKGKGCKSGVPIMTCSACRGSGMRPYIRHFIPGMQHPCFKCKGTGETLSETITEEDLCEECEGEKIVKKKVELEVHVEKGMQNGEKITFTRQEFPTSKGGGCVYTLQQEEHLKFKRKGDDLFAEHTISLMEALSGCFQFGLTHLDNRKLIIKSQPGEVVKPGGFKAINDEGMPMYQRPSMRGKLYIHFTVEFPDALRPDQCKAIEAALPPRQPSPQPTDVEEVEEATLHDANQQQAQEAYDDIHREMVMKTKDTPGEGGAMRKRKTTLHDALVGTTIKAVRVNRNQISDNVIVSTPYRHTSPYGMGSETSMHHHPSRTPPLHPHMTPMTDLGLWLVPDILVNVRHSSAVGVIREVLPQDGACKIGTGGDMMMITAHSSEIEPVVPKKSDRIKIMGGPYGGSTGKLIGVDGSDGVVKLDDTLDVKILDMTILAKLAQSTRTPTRIRT